MRNYNRRDFISTTLTGAGLLLTAQAWDGQAASSSSATSFKGTDTVTLGRTGIKVSRLAQGTGFNGGARVSEHVRMGQKACIDLVRYGLDQGIRFVDMADLYGTHLSVRQALKGTDRDKYVLLSKLWARKEFWNSPSGGAQEEVDRYRQELGVDMLDICLIHCMTEAQWPQTHERVRDELSALKEKGAIRAVGVSCHDFGALKTAATYPWVDVIFARINHKGGEEYSMDGTAEEIAEVLKLARANGKAVVGMKIFGAGKLVEPEQKDTSLKFVFSNKLVDAITIGMLSRKEMDDTLKRMERLKLA